MIKVRNPGPCALCGCIRDLTFHHLIPRKLHRRERIRRKFSPDTRYSGLHICRPCHRGLHRIYDEATLADRFHTRERILADPPLSKHIAWSARQKLGPSK